MPIYYYPSGQYPTSTTQQYRPIASVQYSAQRGQQLPQTAQQAGTWNLSPISSSNPLSARKSHSCPLWMNIQVQQFKPAHCPFPGKITGRLINSVRESNRYQKVKPRHSASRACMLRAVSTNESGILLVYFEAERQPYPYLPSSDFFFFFYFNLKRIPPQSLRLGDHARLLLSRPAKPCL